MCQGTLSFQIGSSGSPAFLKHFDSEETVIDFTNLDVVFQVTEKIVIILELFILDFALRAKADVLEMINSIKLFVSWFLGDELLHNAVKSMYSCDKNTIKCLDNNLALNKK